MSDGTVIPTVLVEVLTDTPFTSVKLAGFVDPLATCIDEFCMEDGINVFNGNLIVTVPEPPDLGTRLRIPFRINICVYYFQIIVGRRGDACVARTISRQYVQVSDSGLAILYRSVAEVTSSLNLVPSLDLIVKYHFSPLTVALAESSVMPS